MWNTAWWERELYNITLSSVSSSVQISLTKTSWFLEQAPQEACPPKYE